MSRLLFVALISVFLVVPASALSLSDSSVKYGSSFSPEISCSGDCPTELDACGDSIPIVPAVSVPGGGSEAESLSCGQGNHEMTVQGGGEQASATLTVESKGMPAQQGKYLFVELGVNGEKLRDFLLTNSGETFKDRWGGISTVYGERPALLLQETDWGTFDTHDDTGAYLPEKGEILRQYTSLAFIAIQESETAYAGGVNDDGLGAEDIRNQGFSDTYSMAAINGGCDTDLTDLETCSPVHENGDFAPSGEIIVAREPGNSDAIENYQFFICREGSDGKAVATPNKIYRCDADRSATDPWRTSNTEIYQDAGDHEERQTNDWDRTTECSDGVDNNGNGVVDGRSECDSPQDSSEGGVGPCSPYISQVSSSFVARYDRQPDGSGGCTDGETQAFTDPGLDVDTTVEAWNPPSSPIEFQCSSSTYPDGLIGYSGVNRNNAFETCANLNDYHGGEVEMVEFYPTSEWLEQKVGDDGVWEHPSYFGEGSELVVTDEYGWAPDVQSIHQAELRYAPSCGEVLSTSQCQFLSLSSPSSYGHQSSDIWEPKNLTNLDDGYSTSDARESWTVANAGAPDDDQIFSDPLQDERIFPGGFAGECHTGQRWMYRNPSNSNQGWYCSGALGWNFRFHVPDIDSNQGEQTVGIFLHPEIFHDENIAAGTYSDQSFAGAWFEKNGEVATIEEVRFDCYAGSGDDSFELSSSSDAEIWPVPNSVDETVFLSDTVALSGESEYTCKFEFRIERPDGSVSWEDEVGTPDPFEDPDKASDQLNIGDYLTNGGGFLRNVEEVRQDLPGE